MAGANDGTTAASIIYHLGRQRLVLGKDELYATRAAFVLAELDGPVPRVQPAQVDALRLVGLAADAAGRVGSGQQSLVVDLRNTAEEVTGRLARWAGAPVDRIRPTVQKGTGYRFSIWQRLEHHYHPMFGPVETLWLRGTYGFRRTDIFQGDLPHRLSELVGKKHADRVVDLWCRSRDDKLLDRVVKTYVKSRADHIRAATRRDAHAVATYAGMSPRQVADALFDRALAVGVATPRDPQTVADSLLRLGYPRDPGSGVPPLSINVPQVAEDVVDGLADCGWVQVYLPTPTDAEMLRRKCRGVAARRGLKLRSFAVDLRDGNTFVEFNAPGVESSPRRVRSLRYVDVGAQ